jgi:hypothetical protein
MMSSEQARARDATTFGHVPVPIRRRHKGHNCSISLILYMYLLCPLGKSGRYSTRTSRTCMAIKIDYHSVSTLEIELVGFIGLFMPGTQSFQRLSDGSGFLLAKPTPGRENVFQDTQGMYPGWLADPRVTRPSESKLPRTYQTTRNACTFLTLFELLLY